MYVLPKVMMVLKYMYESTHTDDFQNLKAASSR